MAINPICNALLSHQSDEAIFLEHPDGKTVTYGALRTEIAHTAGALQAAGVEPGDRVLCQIEKSPEALTLYLATVAAGAVFVPLNPAYTAGELDYFLEDADPALLVLDDTTLASAATAQARGVAVAQAPALTKPNDHALAEPVPRDPGDLAAILYTSGTTGRSKGAMLTHNNLISNAKALKVCWRFTAKDALIHALPVFHTHGLFVATNVILAAHGRLIFCPKFDLDQLAEIMPRATAIMGVPTFYTRIIGDVRFNHSAMKHLRLVISGSAPLLADSHRAFEAQTGQAILERYGMTETNMITSNPFAGERRAGTVGHTLPGVGLRLEGRDDAGIGSIEVRGPNVTSGYWQNTEKTAESFTDDGWFITGDLGQLDEEGYLTIVGRSKDLVISGGFNVYPKEVEVQIDALPGVVESAVYGLPHPDLGEAVAAAVVLETDAAMTAEDVRTHLAEHLARYKIPREVQFLEELPRNAMGKVQKAALRAS